MSFRFARGYEARFTRNSENRLHRRSDEDLPHFLPWRNDAFGLNAFIARGLICESKSPLQMDVSRSNASIARREERSELLCRLLIECALRVAIASSRRYCIFASLLHLLRCNRLIVSFNCGRNRLTISLLELSDFRVRQFGSMSAFHSGRRLSKLIGQGL